MARVLFLEDEEVIADVLTEYMKIQGHEVIRASDGDEAAALCSAEPFDLALLDIMVPGRSGLEVLAVVREKQPHAAVLMLTALGDEQTQIQAFNAMADDYIVKPVSPILLLKRIDAVLRRTAPRKEQAPSEGPLVVDDDAWQAFWNGKTLQLTLSEFLLLQTLYKNPKRAFNREQLILRIFNEEYIGNDRIIDAHVKNLRKKLPVDCIRTVIGVGYQFSSEALQ